MFYLGVNILCLKEPPPPRWMVYSRRTLLQNRHLQHLSKCFSFTPLQLGKEEWFLFSDSISQLDLVLNAINETIQQVIAGIVPLIQYGVSGPHLSCLIPSRTLLTAVPPVCALLHLWSLLLLILFWWFALKRFEESYYKCLGVVYVFMWLTNSRVGSISRGCFWCEAGVWVYCFFKWIASCFLAMYWNAFEFSERICQNQLYMCCYTSRLLSFLLNPPVLRWLHRAGPLFSSGRKVLSYLCEHLYHPSRLLLMAHTAARRPSLMHDSDIEICRCRVRFAVGWLQFVQIGKMWCSAFHLCVMWVRGSCWKD